MEQETSQEVTRYMQLMQKQLDQEQIRRMQFENETSTLSAFQANKDPGIIEYQLDLKEELDRIYHLLSGHVIKVNSEGSEIWDEPEDDRLKIFSDYGVKQIMNIISFYINRNTLLSNYDSETITWKMKDFGIELADLIYNRYEAFFYYPTPEDLYDKYLPIINSNKQKFPSFIRDGKVGDKILYEKCLRESNAELQLKLRHYPIMVLSLIDAIHSTYNRALGGRERESLRKSMHVSQTTSNNPEEMMNMQPKKGGVFGKFKT